MSKRYYIVAMMMLVHNIAWTINTGMYFIPTSVGTGVFSQKETGDAERFMNSLGDPDSKGILEGLKRRSGNIGLHSASLNDFQQSLQSANGFLNKPKIVNFMGLGYQFTSNLSIEVKPTALLNPGYQLRNSNASFIERLKNTLLGNEWKYGLALSGQFNVPLTSSIRFYGKAGKALYFYKSKPTAFDLKKCKDKAFNRIKNQTVSELFSTANSFGGLGFYYQWSSNKLLDLSWECYLPTNTQVSYLNLIKLGMNIYL